MYYFIGIKGAGMSALACIMHDIGYEVMGSDVDKHFFTESELLKRNIKMLVYNKNNIKDNFTIIRGASIKDDHIELIEAKNRGLKIIEYNEMVGILSKKYKTICVSGCHGKTTTVTMLKEALNPILGINYLIGDGSGYANLSNEYFALEACEYKRHFLAYFPYYSIITNIDLDHVDYFKDIDDVILAYQQFSSKTKKMIIANGDDVNVLKLKTDKVIKYFGLGDKNDIRAINVVYSKDGISFDVLVENKLYGSFNLPLFGKHQLLDVLSVIAICYYENIDAKLVQANLENFKGAKRRFSQIVLGNNVIIDDYAHHSNEVRATIEAIKQKYKDKDIIAIFQPHTFSRTKQIKDDLISIFKDLKAVYILDIHSAREKQEDYPDITSNIIIDSLDNAYHIPIDDASILSKYDNAVFAFMSPNDISILENDLISRLNDKNKEKNN